MTRETFCLDGISSQRKQQTCGHILVVASDHRAVVVEQGVHQCVCQRYLAIVEDEDSDVLDRLCHN